MTLRRASRFWGGNGRGVPSALLADLVAYWKFNSDGVDSVAGKTPTVSTNLDYTQAGIIGNSLRGLGFAQILRFADSDDFSFTSGGGVDLPFSISMWVKVDNLLANGGWLINKRNNTSGGDEYQILIGGPNLGAFHNTVAVVLYDRVTNAANINTRTGNVAGSGQPLRVAFSHVVITYSGSKTAAGIKIYVNGSAQTLTTGSAGTYTGMPNGTSTMGFLNANWSPGIGEKLDGKIDEAGIWKNRELTASEVLELYNSGSGITYPF